MDQSGLPFDDVRRLISGLEPLQHEFWQFGEPGEQGLFLIDQDRKHRVPSRPLLVLFAGAHAVEAEIMGDSSANWAMEQVSNICSGDSPINRKCEMLGFGFKVFDLALELPVGNISREAAMDEKTCTGTIAFGMEAIAGGADLLCIGSIAQRACFSNTALMHMLGIPITAAFYGKSDKPLADLNDKIGKIMSLHQHEGRDALELMRRLGGRETAAIFGAVLAARTQGIPVVLEGQAAFAAVSVLHSLNPIATRHCVLAGSASVTNQVGNALGLPFHSSFERELSYGESVLELAQLATGSNSIQMPH